MSDKIRCTMQHFFEIAKGTGFGVDPQECANAAKLLSDLGLVEIVDAKPAANGESAEAQESEASHE